MSFMLEAAARSSSSDAALPIAVVIFLVVLYIAMIVFMFYVYGRIIGKTGYSWTWVFIMLVPGVNIVMFFMFAFKEWPIEREVAHLRQALQSGQGMQAPYGGGQPYSGGQPYQGGQPYGSQPYGGSAQPQPQSQPQSYDSQPPYGGQPYGNTPQ